MLASRRSTTGFETSGTARALTFLLLPCELLASIRSNGGPLPEASRDLLAKQGAGHRIPPCHRNASREHPRRTGRRDHTPVRVTLIRYAQGLAGPNCVERSQILATSSKEYFRPVHSSVDRERACFRRNMKAANRKTTHIPPFNRRSGLPASRCWQAPVSSGQIARSVERDISGRA
jgi:hypothetical protein